MARFKFKLEKVLDYRRQLEEEAMMLLAKATKARDDQQHELDQLRVSLEENEKTLHERRDMTVDEMWLYRNYSERLLLSIYNAEVRLSNLERKVAEARQNLATKAIERKVLEKLKTKQADEHAKQESLKEQKEFDEMSSLRFEHANI